MKNRRKCIDNLICKLKEIKMEALDLRMLRTYQEIDKAINKAGWELATLIEDANKRGKL